MRPVRSPAVLFAALALGCARPPLEVCPEDAGAPVEDLERPGPPPPVGFDLAGDLSGDMSFAPVPCPAPARWIFTLDENGTFSRFLPDTLVFQDLGQISCPAQPGAQPNSMAVARDATAWVDYTSGELFHLDTQTLACAPTGFTPSQLGFANFSLSFAEDAPGSVAEKLFAADIPAAGNVAELGLLNLNTLVLSFAANLGGTDKPELTGDDHANLWGFFPSGGTPKVARIDKQSGALDRVTQLPDLSGQPRDWAFAAWGDDFYIFLRRDFDPSTKVYRLTPDGALATVIDDSGRAIPGVGVAVCAGSP
jgi:hypothetical protein